VLARDTISQPKKRAFLAAYAKSGIIAHACRAAEIPRKTYYQWCEHDLDFTAAARLAYQEAGDHLEEVALERGTIGVPTVKEIYERCPDGELRLVRREVSRNASDTLLIFALKGARPDKYRERHDVTVTGPVVKVVSGFDPAEV
jgi:hypothetical protein